MKTSQGMKELIARFEGLRLKAYKCPAGIWTIAFGATTFNGKRVTEGLVITKEQAYEQLERDLAVFERGVEKCVKKPITQDQFDALVSFSFNVGLGSLSRSTLLKKVNANPSDPTIRDSFAAWNKAGGKVLAGLTKRRKAEADWYFGIKV